MSKLNVLRPKTNLSKSSQTTGPSRVRLYFKAFTNILLKIQPYFAALIALIIAVPSSFFLSQAITQLESRPRTIYREGVIGSLRFIDPLPFIPGEKAFSQLNRDVSRLLWDPLFASDINGSLVPLIGAKYEIKDNATKFIITLADRKWSNNAQISSDDVIATIQTIQSLGESNLYYAAVEGVKLQKIDNKTLILQLDSDKPNSAFLESLYFPILPASMLQFKYREYVDENFSNPTNLISSREWELASFHDEYIELKNPTTNKSIRFVFYNSVNELERALNAGFIDGYYTLDIPAENGYEEVNKFNLSRQVYSIYFNLSDNNNSIIKDPSVRKAISYALNRADVAGNYGVMRQSIFLDKSWAYNGAVNTYAYSIDRANKTLDDAGYKKDGEYRKSGEKILEFTLSIPDIIARVKQAEIIREQLRQVGIKMNIKKVQDTQILDNGVRTNIFYNSEVITKKYDAMIYSVEASLDPDKFSQWHSSKIPDLEKKTTGLNFSSYSNIRADAFLRQGRSQLDQNARKTPYSQFQRVFYDDPPATTLYSPYMFYVSLKRVKSIDFSNSVRIEDRFSNFDKWEF